MIDDGDNDPDIVPGPGDEVMVGEPAEPALGGPIPPAGAVDSGDDLESDLDMMLELLQVFDVEYTLVQDESGATIEVVGGDRKAFGFQGLAVTFNFGPTERAEEFLFIGLTKL